MKKTFLGRVFYVFFICALAWTQTDASLPKMNQEAGAAGGTSIYSPISSSSGDSFLTNQTPLRVCYLSDDGNFCEYFHLKEGENVITVGDENSSDSLLVLLDTQEPVIALLGENPTTITKGEVYEDAGATAIDEREGDLTEKITINNQVNASAAGTYFVTYDVSDSAGNLADSHTRTVNVINPPADSDGDGVPDGSDNCVYAYNPNQADKDEDGIGDACDEENNGDEKEDTTPPVISLMGESEINIFVGEAYEDRGASAWDDVDGDITSLIEVFSPVDANVAGKYIITYNASDSSGNRASQVTRKVNVLENIQEGSKEEGGGVYFFPKFNPKDALIHINGGNEETQEPTVTLFLQAEGADWMAISNLPDFSDSVWGIYAPAISWKLSEGSGEKTVYAKFKSENGAESAVYSASIMLMLPEDDDDSGGEVRGISDSRILDGDIIQCPACQIPYDVYVVKISGDRKYIRRLSEEAFQNYPHLKWENLKQVGSLSGYFLSELIRVNTGANGLPLETDKVYKISDDGTKYWVNMTEEEFYARGGREEEIFSANRREIDSYQEGYDVVIQ